MKQFIFLFLTLIFFYSCEKKCEVMDTIIFDCECYNDSDGDGICDENENN